MLRITVLDSTAEGRRALVGQIDRLIRSENAEAEILPHCEVDSVSRQELSFQTAPDVCVLGENYVNSSPADISKIRTQLPRTAIVVISTRLAASLASVERLARLGVEEVLPAEIDTITFFRKLILLSHRVSEMRRAKIIVLDSAQGGLGVTSLAAGLGEAIAHASQSVAVVDFDLEGRDLSRYLQAKPYINENLLALLDRHRPFSDDATKQCCVPVWDDDDKFACIPPIPRAEIESSQLRALSNFIESISKNYDYLIFDAAAARGALRRALYGCSDRVVLILNNDPANLSPAVNRASEILNSKPLGASVHIAVYAPYKFDLPLTTLKNHFLETTQLPDNAWLDCAIPFSTAARCWPASGQTIYSCGDAKLNRALESLLIDLGIKQQAVKALQPKLQLLGDSLCSRVKALYASGCAKIRATTALQPAVLPVQSAISDNSRQSLDRALPAPPLKSLESFVFNESNTAAAPLGSAAAF